MWNARNSKVSHILAPAERGNVRIAVRLGHLAGGRPKDEVRDRVGFVVILACDVLIGVAPMTAVDSETNTSVSMADDLVIATVQLGGHHDFL
jgi:hypothetical protein